MCQTTNKFAIRHHMITKKKQFNRCLSCHSSLSKNGIKSNKMFHALQKKIQFKIAVKCLNFESIFIFARELRHSYASLWMGTNLYMYICILSILQIMRKLSKRTNKNLVEMHSCCILHPKNINKSNYILLPTISIIYAKFANMVLLAF